MERVPKMDQVNNLDFGNILEAKMTSFEDTY